MLVKRDKCQDFKVNSTLQFPALKSLLYLGSRALIQNSWRFYCNSLLFSYSFVGVGVPACMPKLTVPVIIPLGKPLNGRNTAGSEAGEGAGREGKRKAHDAALYHPEKNKRGSCPCSAEGLMPEGGGPFPGVRTCRGEGADALSVGMEMSVGLWSHCLVRINRIFHVLFPLTSDGDKAFPKVLPDLYVKLLRRSQRLLLS